ncbi:uncharacterized protein LOC132732622 [Ruditapes philippinarum]|uniref:uncharacterized protein LOC132732622 n=1 Tax=Ruditapes philippinarum TaxID=129788 RepID=UPI00295B0C24|nr:uncharacterized protein LOC132732622 [Ruditapes philippinarum]
MMIFVFTRDCGEMCIDDPDMRECVSFSDMDRIIHDHVPKFVLATRGLMISSIILHAMCLLLAIRFGCVQHISIRSAIVCIVLLIVGCILLLTAMIVYGVNSSYSMVTRGAAFYLPLVSTSIAIFSAYSIVRARRALEENRNGYTAVQ